MIPGHLVELFYPIIPAMENEALRVEFYVAEAELPLAQELAALMGYDVEKRTLGASIVELESGDTLRVSLGGRDCHLIFSKV